MQELSGLLSKFGPGVAYGTDTIQSMIDDLADVDYSALIRAFPTLVNPSTESRHYLNDEFLELDQIRESILGNIEFFLGVEDPKYPTIQNEILPEIEAPIHVIYNIFLPIIEKITTIKPEPILKVLNQLSTMISKSSFEENWDLPIITNRLLLWMSSIIEKSDCPPEVVKKIIELWVQIIESTHRAEYILRLALCWFKNPNVSIDYDISSLSKLIKKSIHMTTFADYDITKTNKLYLHEIMPESNTKPTSLKEVRQRRIAACKGFLYVAEPTTGLTKFGTGVLGTVFASNERSSSVCVNCDIHSLCVCNNHLLLGFQGQAKGTIDVMSIESLERLGQLECDAPIPQGPFTAAGDMLYIISKSILYCYEKKGMKITLKWQKGLIRPEREFFPVALPRDYEKYVSLITDGLVIGIVFAPFLIGNVDTPLYHQYNMSTGELMQTESLLQENLSSFCVAVDIEGNTIIEAPFWDTVYVRNLSPVYKFLQYYAISPPELPQGNIPLQMMNALLPLLASRVSLKLMDLSQIFALQNTDLVFDLIELMKKDERYSVFADAAVSMIAIFEYQASEYHTYDVQDIIDILDLKNVSSISRINFMKAFVRGFKKNFLMTTSDCSEIIKKLSPYEVSQIFSDGFHDIYGFLLAILNEPNSRVLEYLNNNLSTQYSFINAMTFSLLRGALVDKVISVSAAVPLFKCIKNANPYVLPTLLAPILPLLHIMLEEDPIVAVVFPQLSTILASLEGLCSASHLNKYAKKHFESRVSNSFIETTVIEESPHPYENNTSYIHPYHFPGAIRITISFDPQTSTEEECDFLQIFSDIDCTEPICPKLSGPNSKWEPIIVNSQRLIFKFTSDPSLNDYGYKAYIQVKSFSTALAYKSPQIFYDLSRALFLMLLNVSKRYDTPPEGFSPESFSFPSGLKPIKFTFEEAEDLINKICKKFHESPDEEWVVDELVPLFDPISCFPMAYSYLKYIYDNCTEETGDVYYLLKLASMHPEVAEELHHDMGEMFSEIGALLMQNTLGLQGEMYNFLFSALKTSKGQKFAIMSFKEAGVLCESPNPSFEIILQAATKIQICLSIIGPHIIDEISEVVPKFLAAYRNIIISVSAPSILSLNEKIPLIFTEIAKTYKITSQFFTCVRENLALVTPTPPTSTNPFVLFALLITLNLGQDQENNDFVLSVILLSLKFKTTHIIPLIQQILKKFTFATSIEERPEIVGILESIGKGFSFNVFESTEHELFDVGPSFSFARATIVRRILDEKKIDQLVPIIQKHDNASIGALLVLSACSFPPHINMQVRIKSTGQQSIISSMDYLEYRFRNEDGFSFALPAFDVSSFEFTDLPFVPILPKRIGHVSQELIDALMDCIEEDDLQGRFARSALAELSYNTPLPYELAHMFGRNSLTNKQENHEIKLELRHFCEGDTYVCTKSIPAFSIKVMPNMTIGYCSGQAKTTFQSFKVSITNEGMINFPAAVSQTVVKLESDTIILGFFGQYKQLFIQSGGIFVMPPVFLSIMEDPCPFIVSQKEPVEFNPNPNIHSFLMKSILPISSLFSHVVANNRLYSLFLDELKFNGVSPSQIHFIPEISDKSKFTYLEFNLRADSIKVCVHPNTMRAVRLYEYMIANPKLTTTFGLYIDFETKTVFVTSCGKIIEDSVFKIKINSPITVSFEMKCAEKLKVNSGFAPFIFDVRRFTKPVSDKVFAPTLSADCIPYSFEPVFQGRIPFELQTVNGESQHKAEVMFERPCILTAADIDAKLYHRSAVFTQIPGTGKASVRLFNHRSQTWISLDLPMRYIYSLADCTEPQNVYAAYERMQRTLRPYLSPSLFFPMTEQANKGLCMLTPGLQRDFFTNKINMDNNLIHILSVMQHIDTFSDDSILEKVVTQAATVLGDDDFTALCCDTLSPIFAHIAIKKPTVFLNLVKKSVNALLSKRSLEPVVVSNKHNDVLVEVERRNADAIYVRFCDTNLNLPLIANSFNQEYVLRFESQNENSQMTLFGDMFTISNLGQENVAFLEIYPISMHTSGDNNCFRLALQIISFVVSHCERLNLSKIMHEEIFLPLFERAMSQDVLLFGSILADWLIKIISTNLLHAEYKQKYSKLIDLENLLLTRDSKLGLALSIFSLHTYVGDGKNDSEIRERLINIVEPFLEVKDANTAASKLFKRISADLLSPFSVAGSVFPFLRSIRPPLITSFAFESLMKSRSYKFKHELVPEKSDENVPQNLFVDTINVPRVYVKLSENNVQPGRIKFGRQEITSSGFIELNDEEEEIEFSLTRDENTQNLKAEIFTEKAVEHPSYSHFLKIFSIFKELHESWTTKDEAMAHSIAICLIEHENLLIFDDKYFEKLFPTVSVEASRYRVSLLMSMLKSCKAESPDFPLNSSFKNFIPLISAIGVPHNDKLPQQQVCGYVPISIVSLTNFYVRAAQQFATYGVFPGENFIRDIQLLNIKDLTTILRVVREAKDDIFEQPLFTDESALIPRSTATSLDELIAFIGFGFHMMMNASAGRSLPLPVSAVVIRFAFGGTITNDDFFDIDPEFAEADPTKAAITERLDPIMPQLRAIRCGVQMAQGPRKIFDVNSPIFPWIIQSLPLTFPRHMTEKLNPMLIPRLREEMFVRKTSLLEAEDKEKAISDIVQKLLL